jgi:hypothetical protein
MAMAQTAEDIGRYAEKKLVEKSKNEANLAYLKYTEETNELINNYKIQNVNSESSASGLPTLNSKLKEIRSKYSNSLSGNASEIYNKNADNLDSRNRIDVSEFVALQQEKVIQTNTKNIVENEAVKYIKSTQDDDINKKQLLYTIEDNKDVLRRLGFNKEMFLSETFLQKAQFIFNTGNKEEALGFLKENSDYIKDANKLSNSIAMFEKSISEDKSDAEAIELLSKNSYSQSLSMIQEKYKNNVEKKKEVSNALNYYLSQQQKADTDKRNNLLLGRGSPLLMSLSENNMSAIRDIVKDSSVYSEVQRDKLNKLATNGFVSDSNLKAISDVFAHYSSIKGDNISYDVLLNNVDKLSKSHFMTILEMINKQASSKKTITDNKYKQGSSYNSLRNNFIGILEIKNKKSLIDFNFENNFKKIWGEYIQEYDKTELQFNDKYRPDQFTNEFINSAIKDRRLFEKPSFWGGSYFEEDKITRKNIIKGLITNE